MGHKVDSASLCLLVGAFNPFTFKVIIDKYSEGDQPWDFFGGTDAEAETPVFWPPHAKS